MRLNNSHLGLKLCGAAIYWFANLTVALSASPTDALPIAEHVVIIGVDGLSPRGIAETSTPALDRLIQNGASTMHARAVMPTSSSPNWASMIMGAGPEQHGITSNDWERDKFDIAPTTRGGEGIFPTIFGLARKRYPDARIAVFHDWDGFGRLVERESCDVVVDADGPIETTRGAIDEIEKHQPKLLFVHLDHVDHAGHTHGWYTPEYNQAVGEADRLIGELLKAIEAADIDKQTAVIVTSDHGGIDKGHGGNSMMEVEIPWIIAGPQVRRGHTIAEPVNQFDTAATAAYVLGLRPPACWIARPCAAAFETGKASEQ